MNSNHSNIVTMSTNLKLIIMLSCIACAFLVIECDAGENLYLVKLIKHELSRSRLHGESTWTVLDSDTSTEYFPEYISSQDGLKERDKIKSLPGQPGVEFNQYSGYVTVDSSAGRALFYYFVEATHDPSSKPLVLWLNGGPVCSSFGNGAMMEIGPFRVNKDGQTLYRNEYAWNNDANIIFLESPAGVGFSYSNTTSDYELSGDKRTAQDSYVFLVNWLERFPEYKTREFFIAGESYAGHYVPQLAQLILHNKLTNQTKINLKGIAIGNAYIDLETTLQGSVDYYWTHALISDEMHYRLRSDCKLTSNISDDCMELINQASNDAGNIYPYDIYAPLCNSSMYHNSVFLFDPCSENYISKYLNNLQVQKALHANVTVIPYPWQSCSSKINRLWKDKAPTVLPIIEELMIAGLRVWMYSGDTDGSIPVTCTRYAVNKLKTPVKTAWYAWYTQGEVGGYAVEYQNLTFVTVRGAGHFVPSYQPARALVLFTSFIEGKLPPRS